MVNFISKLRLCFLPNPTMYLLLLMAFLQSACMKPQPEELLGVNGGTPTQRVHHGGGLPMIVVANPGNYNDIQPSLQAAIDNAVAGSIISIPAGTFVLNKSIVVTKFISIKGAGMDLTALYRSETVPDSTLTGPGWETMFLFNINNTASSNIVISDMSLKSKKPSASPGDGGSLAADFGISMVRCVDFSITRCRFENFGNAAISVDHDDAIAAGLIYKNEFTHNFKGFDGLGLGYGVVVYGANKQWISNPGFGSANFIFIEDNTFNYHRHSVAAGGCGLYVFRYNTVNNNLLSQAIDAHEARLTGLNFYSTRAVEVYNNQVINTLSKDGNPIVQGGSALLLTERAIHIRGGEALIHNNVVQGFRFAVSVENYLLSGIQPYPVFTQIGYNSGVAFGPGHSGADLPQGDGDVFVWNTTFTPVIGQISSGAFYNYQPQYFVEGRDFHLIMKPAYTSYIYPHPRRI
jgi:hypothetical protein